MTSDETIASVRNTTATKASVRRAWKVRGRNLRSSRKRTRGRVSDVADGRAPDEPDEPTTDPEAADGPDVTDPTGGATGSDASGVNRAAASDGVDEPNGAGGSPRSAFGECVSGATDSQDECGRRRIVLDLVAEMADMDVDRLLVLVERLVITEQLQELPA